MGWRELLCFSRNFLAQGLEIVWHSPIFNDASIFIVWLMVISVFYEFPLLDVVDEIRSDEAGEPHRLALSCPASVCLPIVPRWRVFLF